MVSWLGTNIKGNMVLNVANDGHSIKPKIETITKTASNQVTAVHHQRFAYK